MRRLERCGDVVDEKRMLRKPELRTREREN